MKKWMVAFLLLAFVTTEMSCVVRVRERRHPAPPPPTRAVVVY